MVASINYSSSSSKHLKDRLFYVNGVRVINLDGNIDHKLQIKLLEQIEKGNAPYAVRRSANHFYRKKDEHDPKICERIVKILFHSSTMVELRIHEAPDNEIFYLPAALIVNTSLSSLHLRNVYTRRIGLKLGSALAYNSTLKSLSLYSNQFTDRDAVGFSKMLRFNCSITSLDLAGLNNFGPSGIKMIYEAMESNTTIISLTLNNGLLNVPALGKMLEVNSTLRILNLSLCDCSPERSSEEEMIDSQAIQRGLENSSLHTFNLSQSLVDPTFLVGIAEGLYHNTTLMHLNIDYTMRTNFKWIPIKLLSNMLRNNTTLVSLSSRGNCSKENERLIFDALMVNTTLTSLRLTSIDGKNKQDPTIAGATLKKLLMNNQSLINIICDQQYQIPDQEMYLTNNRLRNLTLYNALAEKLLDFGSYLIYH